MTTIRHTTTLFEYDGPQLFVARDGDGGQYLALLVDSEEGQDRYLVVQVKPELLSQFRAGALELKPLIAEASQDQWYLAATTSLDEPLAIELQRTPIEERFLPDEGFTLADSPPEEGEVETDAERDSGFRSTGQFRRSPRVPNRSFQARPRRPLGRPRARRRALAGLGAALKLVSYRLSDPVGYPY